MWRKNSLSVFAPEIIYVVALKIRKCSIMPRLSNSSEKVIRHVEHTVLDQKYKQFLLLRRPREDAIAHLLKYWEIQNAISITLI